MNQNRPRLTSLPIFFLTVIAVLLLPLTGVSGNETTGAVGQSETRSVEHILVILVEFPDVQHEVERDFVQYRFSTQLNNYIKEMSYNMVSLSVDVTKRWYTMPESIDHYRISSRNLDVDRSRVEALIADALNAVDKEVDFSHYSLAAIYMGAKVADYGMVGLCGYPGMLGWSAAGFHQQPVMLGPSTVDALRTKSGQQVQGGVAIFSSQAHPGTLFHDIAHILGGVEGGERMVPCLYDHDIQARPGPMRESFVKSIINMGFWDTMSCHFYKRELPPPGISSWTRIRLGWLDRSRIKVVKPGRDTEVVLGPLEDGSSEILAIKIPLSDHTYYLIENRQPLGFDRYLPGSGILIMYADDRIHECRHGDAPVRLMNANPDVPNLEGAAFDIGGNDSFEDTNARIRIQIMEKFGQSYKIRISSSQG